MTTVEHRSLNVVAAHSLSISLDNGLSWAEVPAEFQSMPDSEPSTTVDLTHWVSGRYGYLLRVNLGGEQNAAILSRLKITTGFR